MTTFGRHETPVVLTVSCASASKECKARFLAAVRANVRGNNDLSDKSGWNDPWMTCMLEDIDARRPVVRPFFAQQASAAVPAIVARHGRKKGEGDNWVH